MDMLQEDFYQKALSYIEMLINEAEGEFEHQKAGAYRNDATLLREWLQKGKPGKCPVDANKYMDVTEAVGSTPVGPVSVGEEDREISASKVSGPEEISDEDSSEGGVLSPEERTVREQLMQVRAHLNNGQMRQAFALASLVAPRAGADMKDEASQLLDEARRKRNFTLEADLKEGDSALEAGNKEQAEQYYEAALLTDPDNEHAKSALRRIRGTTSSKELTKDDIARLRGGLRDRKNLKHLGEAVYEAEALDAEEKLTPELSKLLPEARQAYDAMRVAHGEETTMMRFGDLASRWQARNRIANLVASGTTYIYDAARNTEINAFDLLQQADKLLERFSQDTAQYEIDVVNQLLPAHPLGAQKRLEATLSQPFIDFGRQPLEKKLIEITGLVENQKKAQEYLADAAKQKDEIHALALTLLARSTFPYQPGMDAEVSQAQLRALSVLKQRMGDAYRKARSLTQMKDTEGAQTLLSGTLELAATWPVEEKPKDLTELIEEGQRIQEFNEVTLSIRKLVADPHQRGTALERFEQLRKDSRFVDWPEMRLFISEMDGYRDIDIQLGDAEDARAHGDWQRIYELTIKIKKSQKVGELSSQVDKLFAEANEELMIQKAIQCLKENDFWSANGIISTVIASKTDLSKREQLEERLSNERKLIDAWFRKKVSGEER
jgi:hypothetical protein